MQVTERVRELRPEAIQLPAGYRIEPVVTGLNYPTAIAWDDKGALLIAESTVPFAIVGETEIRIVRQEAAGHLERVVGGLPHLVNSIAFHGGRLYVSYQGAVAVAESGRLRDLITGLPSWGLHENDALIFGPDGRLYFGQGTVSNAGVIDTYALQRLRQNGHLPDHDTPGAPVVLTGQNYATADMLGSRETRSTGAFSSWGSVTVQGQRIPGPEPGRAANGAIMSADPDGSDLSVYAWGFRNPYGLAFAPDGQLYVTNNGANRIPPRIVSSDPDTFWRVEPGAWHGWPDFFNGEPVTDPAFMPPDRPQNPFLIANHEELLRGRPRPPQPVLPFGLHVAPCQFDFCRDAAFGFLGQAFVPEFGSLLTAIEGLGQEAPAGQQVVVVDVTQGSSTPWATNRDGQPGGLERPVDCKFGPDGNLYVVDLGIVHLTQPGWVAPAGAGVVWRIMAQRNQS
jgi:glucose/arabinose dehydrogenase